MFPALFVLFAALAAPPQKLTYVVPNFRDLTLKIRQNNGLMVPQITTWYFRGARQRTEHMPVGMPSGVPFSATIMQCDQRTLIRLNLRQKTYSTSLSHIHEFSEGQTEAQHPTRRPQSTGPEVLITINSVDTGERRNVGGYEARHIKTTVTVEPSAGAATKPGRGEADSWYLDLPGMGCRPEGLPMLAPHFMGGGVMAPTFGHHDRIIFKRVGVELHGLVIEETSTQRSAGNVIVSKTKLLKSSEEPLDESLFEIPGDFTPNQPERQMPDRIAPEAEPR